MTDIFRSFLSSGYIRAQVLAQGRHVITYVGGFVGGAATAWLLAKGVDAQTAAAVGASICGIIVSLGMWAMSAYFAQSDVKKVDAKIAAAIAAPPNTPAAAIDALKAGKF